MVDRTGQLARKGRVLIAAQPLADSGNGNGEKSGGGLDAAFLGALDQTQAMAGGFFISRANSK
jgi:hypothetical protein